ncbi:MAG: sodium:proton exchanger [Deltaproteobacteria bacterium GWA2_54_12]|nr:MAG: sodium:proton exchanger [Deltaproteobacteria bacterium GWA2_54_12]
MENETSFLINLSAVLIVALVLGLVTARLRLSPIVGYLLGGIILGPQTPGFIADPKMAREFAEIGVILLMFGVGLHFRPRDLWAVRKIAIPGAVGQIIVSIALAVLIVLPFGLDPGQGLFIGIAISVASTVVLVRMLTDTGVLSTSQGHAAVGWLLVEDLFTALVLVVLPSMSGLLLGNSGNASGLAVSLALSASKIAALVAILFVLGKTVIPWLMTQVARTKSRELFTLTVLALALAIATGSAVLFGASMALGAFLAGMVMGQTKVSHQLAADVLPMKDAFAVLFFISVGMLFDPWVILEEPYLLIGLLGAILIAKPLTALAIVLTLRYSIRTALTVAVGLAQIGEFSFILAEEALGLGLLSAEGQSLLIACAMISITLNPLLFRTITPIEKWLRSSERAWRVAGRSEYKGAEVNLEARPKLAEIAQRGEEKQLAVVVGFGPVGQTASRILGEFNIETVIVDLNIDVIRNLSDSGRLAIFGDASRQDILEAAGIRLASYLLVTIPDLLTRTSVIIAARELNPTLRVFVRARYIQERAWLEEVGATDICTDEAESARGLAMLLLREVGADEARIQKEMLIIQENFK